MNEKEQKREKHRMKGRNKYEDQEERNGEKEEMNK